MKRNEATNYAQKKFQTRHNSNKSNTVAALLIPLIAFHLGNPLVHLAELVLEALLQLLTRNPHRVALLPVRVAVGEDLVHVRQELVLVRVLVSVHLGLHRRQVHRLFDHVEVVRHPVALGVDGFFEGADNAGPEAWSLLA